MNEEERFDFEQKHEEDLQRLRGFRLLDDDFMSKVFEDKNCYFFRFFVYVIFINFSHLTPYVITITLILSVFVSISFKRLFIEAGHNNF